MSAIPKDLLKQAATLNAEATRTFAASRKIFVNGSRADLRVPMREIAQTATRGAHGVEANPAVTVYDTSGPYSDPAAHVDLLKGLPPMRAPWIAEREKKRGQTPFPNVTQMHYARRGMVTPEM